MAGEHGWLAGHAAAVPVAWGVMLGAGVLVGLFNGVCIAGFRMPAFMVTLTSMMFFGGLAVWLAQRVAGSESIHQLPDAFVAWGRYPALAFSMALVAAMMAHLLLMRTLTGRWLYALGSNPRVALISGVPVGGVMVGAYALSGVFAALASILITARLETGSATHGRALLLDVIGAAVLGGTSLLGGRGRVAGTVFGVLFLTVLSNGLNLLNVSDFLTTIVKGAVILAAAVLDVWRTGRLRAA
jgi:ribose/xylose/arabinose/galactoside ABC-type transport system permease subunit